MSYSNILIPTDGSEQAANAVEEGIELAAAVGATVHALYVVDEFEAKREEYVAYGERITGEVADAAAEAGVETVTAVETGIAHTEIEQYARDNDIDLVVIGSRGLGGVEELLLGSTADKVIRLIDVPVTVVYNRPTGTKEWMLPSAADTIHR